MPGCLIRKSQEKSTSHWLEPIGRRAASKFSLTLMVTGRLYAELRRRGEEGREEHERSYNGGGTGSGSFNREESGGDYIRMVGNFTRK